MKNYIFPALIIFALLILYIPAAQAQTAGTAYADTIVIDSVGDPDIDKLLTLVNNIDNYIATLRSREKEKNENQRLIQKLTARRDSLLALVEKYKVTPPEERVLEPPVRGKPEPVRTTSPSRKPAGEFEAQYQAALEHYNNMRYQKALEMFQALLAKDMNHSLSDNAQYWIGECYYGLKDYQSAINAFAKVFTFPDNNKLDASQLKLGLCYIMVGDTVSARRELTRLLSEFPESRYTGIGRKKLQEL